ncbi:hypothetical protein TeGR_g2914 [Tetraparma gracilis]|uniref:Uncharacterized protein n=1 Tax=Tetraparma gracilis TaxID=2962635 RepID=A0ABQ6N2U6_9STRA|nr:hypothetical protein TeGR_g2914 [Tetraparma gracilis]
MTNPLPPVPPSHSQLSSDAAALRSSGNDAFNKGDHLLASRCYTLALDQLLPGSAIDSLTQQSSVALDLSPPPPHARHLLSQLLSNRSLAFLKLSDHAAAGSDAQLCTWARPGWPKGHLRLLAALDAKGASVDERRTAARNALLACPGDKELEAKEMGYALLESETCGVAGAGGGAEEGIRQAMSIAADGKDARQGMACGDVGSAYAAGAFGLSKDEARAEEFLRRGLALGDGASARVLGQLMLGRGEVEGAAEMLARGAGMGDEGAAEILGGMDEEAKEKRRQAILQLKVMAEGGDERARGMLEELEKEQQ